MTGRRKEENETEPDPISKSRLVNRLKRESGATVLYSTRSRTRRTLFSTIDRARTGPKSLKEQEFWTVMINAEKRTNTFPAKCLDY
jgi:hypothetical protein